MYVAWIAYSSLSSLSEETKSEETNNNAVPPPPKHDPKQSVCCGAASLTGKRSSNEDEHVTISELKFPIASSQGLSLPGFLSFFAVYDGHNGKEASAFAAQNLHSLLLKSKHFPHDIPKALTRAFLETERLILKEEFVAGTTAVVAVIDGNDLHVAHVGDSRAMLCHNGEAICLTIDHNAHTNDEEFYRLPKRAQCLYRNPRTNHIRRYVKYIFPDGSLLGLAVTRALGDKLFKDAKLGVRADPDVCSRTLDEAMPFLVLACDGVFDVMSNDQVIDFVGNILREHSCPMMASKALVECAIKRGSTDNVTAVVVTFDGEKPKKIPWGE